MVVVEVVDGDGDSVGKAPNHGGVLEGDKELIEVIEYSIDRHA